MAILTSSCERALKSFPRGVNIMTPIKPRTRQAAAMNLKLLSVRRRSLKSCRIFKRLIAGFVCAPYGFFTFYVLHFCNVLKACGGFWVYFGDVIANDIQTDEDKAAFYELGF